ncbi:Insect cuticle protein [Trinorchestia longiramus]|nr:Insect cuticle protein [Trinorchestia longiramus]
MKLIVMTCLLAVTASAMPRPDKPSQDDDIVPIIRDDRVEFADGAYSFDVETGDGVRRSEAGQSKGDAGAVNMAGDYAFTFPDGQEFYLKFVADESGFKPESDSLPVAPAFPYPIPQFVLDQIAFAAEEDANRELDAARGDYVGYD